ncbi:1622_t:CDS:2, partial [Gigaspora margarita]
APAASAAPPASSTASGDPQIPSTYASTLSNFCISTSQRPWQSSSTDVVVYIGIAIS